MIGGILNLLMINRNLPMEGAFQYKPNISDKPVTAIVLMILRRALSIGLSLLETALGHMVVKGSSEGLAEQLKNQSVGAALLIGAYDAFFLLWAAYVCLSVNACLESAPKRVVRLTTSDNIENTQGNNIPPLDRYSNVSSLSTTATDASTDFNGEALHRALADPIENYF